MKLKEFLKHTHVGKETQITIKHQITETIISFKFGDLSKTCTHIWNNDLTKYDPLTPADNEVFNWGIYPIKNGLVLIIYVLEDRLIEINKLRGNLDNIYKTLKDLQITPLLAEYDYVCISEDDYHKHKNELARRGII